MTPDRPCTSCRHYLPPGGRTVDGRQYLVACCQHPKVQRNPALVYAVSLARRYDERCGPSGRGWKPIDKPARAKA